MYLTSAIVAHHLNKITANKLEPDWAAGWGMPIYPKGINFEKAALTLVCIGFGIQKTLDACDRPSC